MRSTLCLGNLRRELVQAQGATVVQAPCHCPRRSAPSQGQTHRAMHFTSPCWQVYSPRPSRVFRCFYPPTYTRSQVVWSSNHPIPASFISLEYQLQAAQPVLLLHLALELVRFERRSLHEAQESHLTCMRGRERTATWQSSCNPARRLAPPCAGGLRPASRTSSKARWSVCCDAEGSSGELA